MPTYTMTGPDGKDYSIDGPAGATADQVAAALQAQIGASAKAALAQVGTGSVVGDSLSAIASGANQGLARLAGLPVDAIANVRDLLKAGAGAAYIAATGKEQPQWLQLTDRAKDIGSGDSIINAMPASMMHAANPEDEGGYLQAIGSAIPAVLAGNPNSIGNAVGQAGTSIASTLAGKYVGDKTGIPALAVTAGLILGATVNPVSSAVKRVIRGDEAGRLAMLQRIEDLRAAGVNNPTLGLASGNETLGGAENLLSSTPGAVSIMRNNRQEAINGMQGAIDNAADMASATRGALPAGTAIQNDVNSFYDRRVLPQYRRLNDGAEGVIGTRTQIPTANALETTERLATPDPAAPASTGGLIPARITGLQGQILADNGGISAPTLRWNPQLQVYETVEPTGMPFGVVKRIRTDIGAEAGSLDNVGRPVSGQMRSVYGALSDDMRNAAVQADLDNGQLLNVNNMPSTATGSLDRANQVYHAGMDRLESLSPFRDNAAPETSYTNLINNSRSRNSVVQTVMKSVTPETRGMVASTLLDEMGEVAPGRQNAAGDVWSPRTFLTEWNRLSPESQTTLLSGYPGAQQVQNRVAQVVRAADMMEANSAQWSNPSGTAANLTARTVLGGIGLGSVAALAHLASPVIPAAAATGVGLANLAARATTSPGVRNWVSTDTPLAEITPKNSAVAGAATLMNAQRGIDAISAAPDVDSAIAAAQATLDPRLVSMSTRRAQAIAAERARMEASRRAAAH